MKDYIVTVEETYFDATKFEIGGFYFVIYKGEKEKEFKCILTAVEKSKIYLTYHVKDNLNVLILSPSDLTSGKYEIKEVKTNENKRLRKENLNLRNAEEMLQSTIRILNNRVDELEKENDKLRRHIEMFSEEEFCD